MLKFRLKMLADMKCFVRHFGNLWMLSSVKLMFLSMKASVGCLLQMLSSVKDFTHEGIRRLPKRQMKHFMLASVYGQNFSNSITYYTNCHNNNVQVQIMISAQTLLDESYKSLQQSVYSVFLIGG